MQLVLSYLSFLTYFIYQESALLFTKHYLVLLFIKELDN